jgi:uncharacterized protein YaeQ
VLRARVERAGRRVALAATIYNFEIELADADRGVYEPLSLKVARHPSETAEHLVTRMLAYCLEFTEGIGFSRGLAHPDDPAIAVRDLTGALLAWIDRPRPAFGRCGPARAAHEARALGHRRAPLRVERRSEPLRRGCTPGA